jgi:hypothetical protein
MGLTTGADRMRAFLIAVAATLALALAAHFFLDTVQMSAAQSTTSATRLDRQERVNNYGREG